MTINSKMLKKYLQTKHKHTLKDYQSLPSWLYIRVTGTVMKVNKYNDYINGLKNKSHDLIHRCRKKSLLKISKNLHDKSPRKSRTREKISQHNKFYMQEAQAHIILNGENSEIITLKLGSRLYKKVKLPLLADDSRDTQYSTKELLKTKKFSNVAGYTINFINQ